MGFLFKKMLRDIGGGWTQFVSVLLMAVISVLIFSGMASVWTGMERQVDSFSEASNLADLWVSAMGITEDDLEDIEAIKGVGEVTLGMSLLFSPEGDDDDSEIRVTALNNDRVSRPVLMEGVPFDTGQEGIWLDREYAKVHGLKPGDTLSLSAAGGETGLEVLGTVMSPEYIYYTGSITETVPNYEKYGYGFVNEETMLLLAPRIVYTQAKIKADGAISEKAFEDLFEDRLICVQDRDDYISFAQASDESSQMRRMAVLFSTVFILLALMTMYTSMVRLVNRQTMQIGAMKALGISSFSIGLHYAGYGFLISAAGGLLGLAAGRYTVSPALMKVKQATLSLPEWSYIHGKSSFVLMGVITLCCMFASVWAAQKSMRGMPVEIMRNNAAKRAGKASAGSGPLDTLSYEWRWIIRNILQNKVRFLMGIIGVAGGIVLMIAGLGIRDAITDSNEFVFFRQFQYETKALLKGKDKIFDQEETVQWLQESNVEIKTDREVRQSVMTVCGKGNLLRFYDDTDRPLALPLHGALISRKLAEELGVRAGATVKVKIFGVEEWLEIKIAGTTKTLSPQGLFMSEAAYEETGRDFEATGLLTASKDVQGISDKDEIKSAIARSQQHANANIVVNSAMSIVRLLIAASVLLSVVILYNLGILSYVERTREYATMKVLGFYQEEIRSIAVRECILTSLLGWALGIPLGIRFLKIYVKIVSFDSFEWVAEAKSGTLLIASVGIVGVSLAINLLLSGKVKRLVMVEALKSVE